MRHHRPIFSSPLRYSGRILVLVALLVGVGFVTPSQAESAKIVLPKRGICAHRGAGSTHPENTLPAFREAIRLGAHQIEFDVRRLKDGELVVIHDATVDRTTNGHGRVAELTIDKIKKLDAGAWKNPKFAGTRVPTLAETLEIMPHNVWLNIHLKGDAKLGQAVAHEVFRQGRTGQAFLACTGKTAKAARKVCPQLRICNMNRTDSDARYVAETIQRKCDFLQFGGHLCKPEEMARLKRAGVRINYYGRVDKPAKLKKLFDAGVDFPLVDKVAEMIRAARALGIEPNRPVFVKHQATQVSEKMPR